MPTWNYVTIHAYGTVEFFNDPERLRNVVTRLTEQDETPRAEPWAVTDAPADFIDAMLKGIVGFTLPIIAARGQMEDEPEPPGGGPRGRGRRSAIRRAARTWPG